MSVLNQDNHDDFTVSHSEYRDTYYIELSPLHLKALTSIPVNTLLDHGDNFDMWFMEKLKLEILEWVESEEI